jgi:hypothetical protein
MDVIVKARVIYQDRFGPKIAISRLRDVGQEGQNKGGFNK